MSIIEGHIVEVRVPQLSESVTEATLLTWHKQVGEAVAEGENLIDVETDKVVLELPASKSGVLIKIIKGDGEKVTSEELVAQIDTAATALQTAVPPAAATSPMPPSVRKLAHEKEVDAGNLQGSGRGGRVTKDDVLNAMQQTTPSPLAVTNDLAVVVGQPSQMASSSIRGCNLCRCRGVDLRDQFFTGHFFAIALDDFNQHATL